MHQTHFKCKTISKINLHASALSKLLYVLFFFSLSSLHRNEYQMWMIERLIKINYFWVFRLVECSPTSFHTIWIRPIATRQKRMTSAIQIIQTNDMDAIKKKDWSENMYERPSNNEYLWIHSGSNMNTHELLIHFHDQPIRIRFTFIVDTFIDRARVDCHKWSMWHLVDTLKWLYI